MTFEQWAEGQMLLNDEIGLSYARRAWDAATERAAAAAAAYVPAAYEWPAVVDGVAAAIRSQDG
jgi:hypothetical protein